MPTQRMTVKELFEKLESGQLPDCVEIDMDDGTGLRNLEYIYNFELINDQMNSEVILQLAGHLGFLRCPANKWVTVQYDPRGEIRPGKQSRMIITSGRSGKA